MVTGDHDFEAELTREAREQAKQDRVEFARLAGEAVGEIIKDHAIRLQAELEHAQTCEFGWHVPSENKSHICRLPKGHPLAHRCTLNKTCQAKYDG